MRGVEAVERGEQALGQEPLASPNVGVDQRTQLLVPVEGLARDDALARLEPLLGSPARPDAALLAASVTSNRARSSAWIARNRA